MQMSTSLEQKIQKLNADFDIKMQEVQASGKYNQIASLTIELQEKIQALVTQEQEKNSSKIVEPIFDEKISPYRQEDCTLNLNTFVYDGDRDYYL